MDVRLVQLLGSFSTARNQYALARLEFAIKHPKESAPPVIDRLLEPSERALREEWPKLEEQLGAAVAFGERHKRDRSLQRPLRELDQYARAIAWVLTVTETER